MFCVNIVARSLYLVKFAREVVRVYDNDCNADMERNGERKLLNFLCSKGNKGSVFVDVGANVGDWSEALVCTRGDIGRLIAVDPLMRNLNLVQKKLERKHFDRFELCECALSDTIGRTSFYINKDPALSGHDSLFNMSDIGYKDGVECIDVETTTLDALSRKLSINNIYFLKIDVEGNELSVLKGAQSLLEQGNISFIQFEFGHAARAARTYLHDFVNFLSKYDYDIFVILPSGLMPLKISPFTENRYSYINFLLVKKAELNKVGSLISKSRL